MCDCKGGDNIGYSGGGGGGQLSTAQGGHLREASPINSVHVWSTRLLRFENGSFCHFELTCSRIENICPGGAHVCPWRGKYPPMNLCLMLLCSAT